MKKLGGSDSARKLSCPEYPETIQSLVGILALQLREMPERSVCHRVARERRGITAEALTVAALAERASHVAGVLRAHGVRRGERVILSLSDPHDFLIGFFATLIAGGSAVPLPTVAESGAPRSFAARVRAVCQDCDPKVVVAERADRFTEVVDVLPRGVALVEPKDLEAEESTALDLDDRPASATAFIQYTSGSTGTPKGVVITHGNILANCSAIRDATGYTRADRMVAWLPLHHDMGLIGGLLTSIYCAAETWLMPPMTFLSRPVTWLEAITAFHGTLTVAPTFAYSLCARKIPDKQLQGIDLSSLRLAYIGAEPVDPSTVTTFIERFRPQGLNDTAMYPVYGLAEATLAVAFPRPGTVLRYDRVDRRRLAEEGSAVAVAAEDDSAATLVSVGHPLPRHRIEIVDPDSGAVLPERRVGELIAYGRSISPRYFHEGTVTRDSLQTGDLAYLADGHVYIVDRIKDLVIIGGQNYAPSDIENVIAEIEGVRRGRIVAFSAAGDAGTEVLHVVAEASPDSWRDPEELRQEIRQRVLQEIGIAAGKVTIVAAGSLERTSSGKIKRRACAEAERDGKLSVIDSQLDLVSGQLRRQVQSLLYEGTKATRQVLGWLTGRGESDSR